MLLYRNENDRGLMHSPARSHVLLPDFSLLDDSSILQNRCKKKQAFGELSVVMIPNLNL
jgi:hypothetical protein